MKFEMTREGCVLATDYLKKVDQYDAFMRNGWSVDGFSLIAWANAYYEKHEGRDNVSTTKNK